MEGHDVLVAFARHRWELSGLIGVHGCFGAIHQDQNIMFFDVGDDDLIFVWGFCLFCGANTLPLPSHVPLCVSSDSGKNLVTFFTLIRGHER